MKILIVNGYPQTQKGAEDFHRYQLIIQELFRTQKDFVDTNFEFIIRRRDNLDDFIYELDSSHVKKTSARAFDYIDMVFVEGDPNLLPWSPQASKIMILLRMCIRTKKVLFTSAFGMQALVFLAATNTEKTIHVVNGKGKGGQLTDIIQSNEQPVGMKPDDYCLDNVTGDLYSFNYETNEWVPKMNVGIHYGKAAQAFGSLGKYVVNTPVYKPRVVEGNSTSYVSKVDEDICYTKKVYLQHWAISELPSDFVVPAKNTWDIHKFNFVNANKTFLVLAESKRSPQILVFEPHCIGTQFNITKKYPITVAIMHNFVTSKLREIKAMTKNHVVSVEKVSEQYRSVAENYFPFSNGIPSAPQQGERKSVSNSRILTSAKAAGSSSRLLDETSSNRPKTAKLAHSGYALAHHDVGNLIVKNNTVRNELNIKLLEQPQGTKGTFYQSRTVTKTGGTDSLEENYFISSKFNGGTTKGYSSTKELHNVMSGTMYQPKRDQSQNNDKAARTNSFGPNFNDSNHGFIYEDNQPQSSFRTEPVFNKNRAEVGRMLYPDLHKETLKEEEFWVPGQLSTKIRPQTATNREKVKIRMETSYSNRFFSTYNKFKNVDPDEARAKPSIRVSGDYITDDEVKRRQEKENNRKNIGPSYVSSGGKNVKAFMIPNYVNLTYSEPAANHKYREVQRNKWVAGPMKLC